MLLIGVIVGVLFVAWVFWYLQNPGVDSDYLDYGGYPGYPETRDEYQQFQDEFEKELDLPLDQGDKEELSKENVRK